MLNTNLKKGASFTWQSILAGVNVFKLGHIWRVGDGENIKIWKDPWIPNSVSRKVISRRGDHLLSKVGDLINTATGSWDDQLITHTFCPVDVDRILAIPLPTVEMKDFVAWSLTKTNIFSVRTAYHAACNDQFRRRSHAQTKGHSGHVHPIRESIWSLKVQNFVWKSLHGATPCRAVLVDRHIKVSTQCPLCAVGKEDLKHLLFERNSARVIWEKLDMAPYISDACATDRAGSTVLEFLLCSPQRQHHQVQNFAELVAVAS